MPGTDGWPSAHFVHAIVQTGGIETPQTDKKVPQGQRGPWGFVPRERDCGWLCGPCGKPPTTRPVPRAMCGHSSGQGQQVPSGRGPWGLFLSRGLHRAGAAPGALHKLLWPRTRSERLRGGRTVSLRGGLRGGRSQLSPGSEFACRPEVAAPHPVPTGTPRAQVKETLFR